MRFDNESIASLRLILIAIKDLDNNKRITIITGGSIVYYKENLDLFEKQSNVYIWLEKYLVTKIGNGIYIGIIKKQNKRYTLAIS